MLVEFEVLQVAPRFCGDFFLTISHVLQQIGVNSDHIPYFGERPGIESGAAHAPRVGIFGSSRAQIETTYFQGTLRTTFFICVFH